ncbi:MAG: hypothetical protein QOG55_3683 [Acidobacteriaceae bacterium]|jgi:hypothetical protein|nr:hypothetical protein [Acidobacteriaceae bacterium]
MNRVNIFQALRSGRFCALVALAGLGLLFTASGAKAAGCGLPYKPGAALSIPFVSPHGNPLNLQEDEESNKHTSIVGLWHVIYTATSAPTPPFPPTPFQFVESYKTWHEDGTEFENAFLPPAGGNICFGVWKELSHGSVKLHHIGLMFATDGAISNVFTVDETDTVAHNGKTYKGNFDFKVFDATNVFGTGTPLLEVTGTTAGTRITVD